MITIENKNSDIYLFNRNSQKIPVINKVKGFQPYFYVEKQDGNYISIDGQKLDKIIVNNPKDVKELREHFLNHYEADILFVNRYIIDRISEIKKEDIRICYLDIEVEKNSKGEFALPQDADGRILSIGMYDNFDKEYTIFCIDYNCKDELELIKNFIN